VYQAHEVAHQLVFGDAISRARAQRQPPCCVPFIREQSENTHGRINLEYFPNRTDSTLFWQIQVHKDHPRSVLAKHPYGLASVRGSPNNFHVRLQADKCAEAFEQEWVVIDYQNPAISLFHNLHYLRCDVLGETLKLASQKYLIWGGGWPQMAMYDHAYGD